MDYKQSSVTGESWRCLHIEINNPSGATPSIRFDEERRIALADGTSIGTRQGRFTRTSPIRLPRFRCSTRRRATLSVPPSATARCMPFCGACTWRWQPSAMPPRSRARATNGRHGGMGRSGCHLRNSLLYSWDGESLFPVDIAALLRQRSVFARVAQPRLVARITQQRLHARVTDGH